MPHHATLTASLRIASLRDQILRAKHAYYNRNDPIMSDAEYDALEDALRLLSPDDPVLAIVGAPVAPDSMLTKARHAIPMGSLSKVNSEAEFRAWWVKSGATGAQASLKMDGASAAAYYHDGRLMQVISRGDGVVGENITSNAVRFKGLPSWVGEVRDGTMTGFSGAVRFEVVLTVADWGLVDPERRKNPRNAGAGIMGRKNGHQSDLLSTYAFDIDETRDGTAVRFLSEQEKITRLAQLGFTVIPHRHCNTPDDVVAYFREVTEERDALAMWIDGAVVKLDDLALQQTLGVTSGRPKGQIAWKFDSSGAETRLRDVVISGGHTGALNPIAELEPVEIGGTTVTSASLANFDEIARLDVAIGDMVWVIKANDIIPKIVRVTEQAMDRRPIPVPTVCPFCAGPVGRRVVQSGAEGAMLLCQSPTCPEKALGKLKRWIKSLEIDGIGDSVLDALVSTFGIEEPSGLYRLRERQEALADLVINQDKGIRLGARRAQSIVTAIEATRTLSLSAFLGSLGVDGLGKRRAEMMIGAAQGTLDTLADWRAGQLADGAFAAQVGVPNTGAALQSRVDALGDVIDALLAAGVVVESAVGLGSKGEQADEVALPTVCVSGKLPSGRKKADYAEPLARAGYALVDEVGKGLSVLVLADPDSTSAKAEKARKLGVRIVGEAELQRMVGDA
jgi:DNA ligase (NAD+)